MCALRPRDGPEGEIMKCSECGNTDIWLTSDEETDVIYVICENCGPKEKVGGEKR